MAEVEIISSCFVPMATDSGLISRLELTPWDLQCLQLDPIPKGMLFRNPNPNLESPITFINHLKNSLSYTLTFFPPLAGRLGSTVHADNMVSFFIDCNNAGAEFTHAVASRLSVSDIIESKYKPDMVLSSLFPLHGVINYEGTWKPLLGVQVSQLIDGFFIAFAANHVVVDGVSFWHFVNSWAEVSRGLGMISKLPNFQRCFPGTCLKGNKSIPLPPMKKYGSDDTGLPPLLERVFHFSKVSMDKLKAKAKSEAGTEKISSLQVISAHILRCVIHSRNQIRIGEENGKSKPISVGMAVGTRSRFPLPEDYFGNAVYLAKTVTTESEILDNSLGDVAQMINGLVGQQDRKATMTFLEDFLKNPVALDRLCDGSDDFLILSSPRHDVYGNDFGLGKPVAVRTGKAQKFDGKITVFPAPEPGGMDVEICLAPETLKVMEVDPEFLEAFTV